MENILLGKVSAFAAANSPCPCGKAAFVLDRIAGYPINPGMTGVPELFPQEKNENRYTPKVGVNENERTYSLHAELPGVSKENIDIQIDGNILLLSGHINICHANSNSEKAHVYKASILLPTNVDTHSIEAALTDGILKISFKKNGESLRLSPDKIK